MDIQKIIYHLEKTKTKFIDITRFSKLPGIYAISFSGKSFPVFSGVKNNQIIYIGKTESSQEKRDAKTHFAKGKTGSSTLRKSIGALLDEKNFLTPIPRNSSDYIQGRLSHFMFDDYSEELISKWMYENLSLAFYEFTGTKDEIENIETKVIKTL